MLVVVVVVVVVVDVVGLGWPPGGTGNEVSMSSMVQVLHNPSVQ